MPNENQKAKKLPTEYHVGSARRNREGEIESYSIGHTAWTNLNEIQKYIRGLYKSYSDRGMPVLAGEFIILELRKRFIEVAP